MEESIAARLREINRRFYAEHAEDFADTRPRLPDGVRRVLAEIPAGAQVLEVGCGDGKVGRALARAGAALYVGVDESEGMIQRALRFTTTDGTKDEGLTTKQPSSPVYVRADITQPGWDAGLPVSEYDWVLAFAVLHHVPGAERRAEVLKDLAGRLRPGGRLAMSNWQLTRSERLMRRVQPWVEAGIDAAEVEPRDYLLGWERGGRIGLRYVHVIDEAEARAMAAAAGLQVAAVFEADGVSGDLAQYVAMSKGK